MVKPTLVLGLMLLLPGCATFATPSPLSFAPPLVHIDTKFDTPTRGNSIEITDLHIKEYEQAQRENADARQSFEVPAIVALIGGIASTAFGGARDGVLFAGTANSALRAGNSYYSPQAKAGMYADAIVALYCIRRSAQGAEASEMVQIFRDKTAADTVIHREVMSGIMHVRTLLTSRLSTAGSYTEISGIAAELEQSFKSKAAAQQSASSATQNIQGLDSQMKVAGVDQNALSQIRTAEAQKLEEAKAAEFQEIIHQCALQAKA